MATCRPSTLPCRHCEGLITVFVADNRLCNLAVAVVKGAPKQNIRCLIKKHRIKP